MTCGANRAWRRWTGTRRTSATASVTGRAATWRRSPPRSALPSCTGRQFIRHETFWTMGEIQGLFRVRIFKHFVHATSSKKNRPFFNISKSIELLSRHRPRPTSDKGTTTDDLTSVASVASLTSPAIGLGGSDETVLKSGVRVTDL